MIFSCSGIFAYLLFPLFTFEQDTFLSVKNFSPNCFFVPSPVPSLEEVYEFYGMDYVSEETENDFDWNLNDPDDVDNLPQVKEYLFLDGNRRLKFLEYGEEKLFVTSYVNKNLTSVNSDYITRNIFDDKGLLIKKQVWKYSGDSINTDLYSQIFYTYDSGKLVDSAINNYFDNTRILVSYYDTGLVKQQELFNIQEEKNIPVSKTSWSYDSDKRVLSYMETFFSSDSKNVSEYSKKTVYEYKKGGDNPDSHFYENGILRVREVYSDLENSTRYMYFDDGYILSVGFTNGKKMEEVLSKNGKVIRRENFGY